jgi:hypothetical protein
LLRAANAGRRALNFVDRERPRSSRTTKKDVFGEGLVLYAEAVGSKQEKGLDELVDFLGRDFILVCIEADDDGAQGVRENVKTGNGRHPPT